MEIERYESFRMQSNYRSTVRREVTAFEFVLDLRHKCVREESLDEEFVQMKCRDCVDEEGWGYAKTGYFEGVENAAEGRITYQGQGEEKAVEGRNEGAGGDLLGDPGCEGINEPAEGEDGDKEGEKDSESWGYGEDHSPGCTCDKSTTFLCLENLSGEVEA